MKKNIIIRTCYITACLAVTAAGLAHALEVENKPPIKFQSLTVGSSSFDQTRVNAVGQALDFQSWPKTNICRVAPKIDKNLLSDPKLVTQENTSYRSVDFGGDAWGTGEWSWRRLVENSQSLLAELPSERKEELLAKLSPEQRNDPNLVETYLKKKLDRYIESRRYRLEGAITIRLCVTPSSRAAQEYLLNTMIENAMPTEALVMMYTGAKWPQGLGTISFRTGAGVSFVRDNICVRIRANGCFANEALPLARKIDSMLIKQPPLTYQQLLSRRPTVTIAPYVDTTTMKDQSTASYDMSVPAGQEIVSIHAFTDGELIAAENGRISLAGKKGKVKVKLAAITRELLADTFERELIIPE